MEKINIWHKLIVHRQKIVLLALLFFALPDVMVAQQRKTKLDDQFELNLPNYDTRLFHYGFTIGMGSSRFKLKHNQYFIQNDSFASVTPIRTPEFSLGFIVNCRLDDFWDLRLMPTVAFYTRTVNFRKPGALADTSQVNESTYIEFPLLLKYKSVRRRNVRMYMVGGIKAGLEAGAKKKEKPDTELRTINHDFSIDYGFGFDIYYPLFKFSPELRISHGMLNLLNKDANPFAQSIQRLSSHTVTLYLHFQ